MPPSDFSSSESGEKQTENFSLFDKMLQPTISINKEGIIQYVNDAVCQLTGKYQTSSNSVPNLVKAILNLN